MDVNYLPMARGPIYLAAGMDWFTCRVFAWRVPSTLEGDPCVAAVEEALARDVALEVLNMDQGSQFTSIEFIKALADREIKISIEGHADRGAMTSSSGFGRLPKMTRCTIIND
jgi:putative transposase